MSKAKETQESQARGKRIKDAAFTFIVIINCISVVGIFGLILIL
tara:strand:- start:343 stop:474 length:132 start_codon:yes stop_codon:yes gene_type:complete